MEVGTMEKGRENEDDDGGQEGDASGDSMGLKEEKGNMERDSTMDTVTSVDSRDTRR